MFSTRPQQPPGRALVSFTEALLVQTSVHARSDPRDPAPWSVVLRAVVRASRGSHLAMQNLRPQPRPADSETACVQGGQVVPRHVGSLRGSMWGPEETILIRGHKCVLQGPAAEEAGQ